MRKGFALPVIAVFIVTVLSSCEAVGELLKAGIWIGIIIVVLVIALVLWLIRKIGK